MPTPLRNITAQLLDADIDRLLRLQPALAEHLGVRKVSQGETISHALKRLEFFLSNKSKLSPSRRT